MKQKFFLGALMAGMAVFTACSNDDEMMMPAGVGEADGDVQEIVLQVANEDGLVAKRGGRPLLSSAPDQCVDNVVIFCVKKASNEGDDTQDKVVWKHTIENWRSVSGPYSNTADGTGRSYTLTLKDELKLDEAGAYDFYAYGYANGTKYSGENAPATYPATQYDFTEPAVNAAYADVVATLKSGVRMGEEVFAGKSTESANVTISTVGTVTKVSGINATLRLARQVAGAFGYFDEIPAEVNGKQATTLRMVVADLNNKLTFDDFNTANGEDADGTYVDSKVMYVVNGSKTESALTADAWYNGGSSSSKNAYVLYTINLQDWFPKLDENKDGTLNASDSWQVASTYSGKAAFKKGSVFAGEFIIPFSAVSGKQTMQLQLMDASGMILKSWNVLLGDAEGAGQFAAFKDETSSSYSIVRNHMYNVGEKPSAGDPTDPDPDGPDGDDPTKLSGDQEIYTDVIANWEMLHDMVLD